MHHHERRPRGHMPPPVQPRWPENAHYAPKYPIYPLRPAPAPSPVLHLPLAAAPYAGLFVPRPRDRHVRAPPPKHMQPQLRRKVSIPKKHVHFNLPPRAPPPSHPPRKPSQTHLPNHHHHHHHRPPTPARAPQLRPSHPNLRPNPAPPKPTAPALPTIYILTFAHTRASTPPAVHTLLTTHLPPSTPHLYTINATTFHPPPPPLCAAYSGVSPIVQHHVMQDPRARSAVSSAVRDVRAWAAARRDGDGEGDVALSVCCMYGTHRSVSIAERIAQGLMGREIGARVVVRHVHRVRGVKDLR